MVKSKKIKQRFATIPVLSPQSLIKRPPAEYCELLPYYGATYLTLLVKDPFWVYAYWEIFPGSIRALKNKFSESIFNTAKIVLRIYDVNLIDFNGSNANRYFDIDVGFQANNWYINVGGDDVSYVGEIGALFLNAKFYPLARSNCVHTPRVGYSSRAEQIWMKVEDNFQTQAFVKPRIEFSNNAASSQRHKADKKTKVIYLTEEDVRNYYSRLNPLLRDLISLNISRRLGLRGKKYSFILEGENEEDRQRILASLPKGSFVRKILIGASETRIIVGEDRQFHMQNSGGGSNFK